MSTRKLPATYRSSPPDRWIEPRPKQTDWQRRHKHGPVQPMDDEFAADTTPTLTRLGLITLGMVVVAMFVFAPFLGG